MKGEANYNEATYKISGINYHVNPKQIYCMLITTDPDINKTKREKSP